MLANLIPERMPLPIAIPDFPDFGVDPIPETGGPDPPGEYLIKQIEIAY